MLIVCICLCCCCYCGSQFSGKRELRISFNNLIFAVKLLFVVLYLVYRKFRLYRCCLRCPLCIQDYILRHGYLITFGVCFACSVCLVIPSDELPAFSYESVFGYRCFRSVFYCFGFNASRNAFCVSVIGKGAIFHSIQKRMFRSRFVGGNYSFGFCFLLTTNAYKRPAVRQRNLRHFILNAQRQVGDCDRRSGIVIRHS